MSLPLDPFILLSVVNTHLRDDSPNLDILCDRLETTPSELEKRLKKAGYQYDPQRNQFVPR